MQSLSLLLIKNSFINWSLIVAYTAVFIKQCAGHKNCTVNLQEICINFEIDFTFHF